MRLLNTLYKVFFTLTILLIGFIGKNFSQVNLEITEIFFGQEGTKLTADWFEIKNTGSETWVSGIDPDIWYDDESASAADADLVQGIQSIEPGEASIVVIGNATDVINFLAVWSAVINLDGIEVGFADGAGLSSNGDTVNIWLGSPQSNSPIATQGYPAAQPSDDGRSFDNLLNEFSTVGNSNGAVETLAKGGNNGDVPNIASPGNQGPLSVDPNAPLIIGDTSNGTPYLSIKNGSMSVGADLNDPTDPAKTIGIDLLIFDADHIAVDITLSATSNNQSVIPDANIMLMGTGESRKVLLNPVGVGYASIEVTASDPDGKTGTFTINYAASDATVNENTSRFHYGASDGSTAQAVGNEYMWIGDDEDQVLRLYNRTQSGMPLEEIDMGNYIGDGEIDIEGSLAIGDTTFWIGSHTTIERSVIFSAIASGAGAQATLSYQGYYNDLREDLINWDNNNLHGYGAGFFNFAAGVEIEGFSADPQNPNGGLLAFRGPLNDGDAILIPLLNLKEIVLPAPIANTAIFGNPILMDLGGRSFRSMDCNQHGCLIVGGPAGTVIDFKLYTWTGMPADLPELRSANLELQAGLNSFEGIVEIPNEPFTGAAGNNKSVQFLVDTGTSDYYDDNTEAKDLPQVEWKKFRSEIVVLGGVVIPPVALPGDVVINELMINPISSTLEEGQWIELYNATGGSIHLNGWVLALGNGQSHLINSADPLIIPAEGFIIIANNGNPNMNGGLTPDYVWEGFQIPVSEGEVTLTASDTELVDQVAWSGTSGFSIPAGSSLALKSPSLDNSLGVNWCVSSTAYGNGDFGTPGAANDCPAAPGFNLQITEIWCGQDGDDLTADWFEITNFGDEAWVFGEDGDLYYDDESQDPNVADIISGITSIAPGESAIVLIGLEPVVGVFSNIWAPDYNLTDVEIGWTDGAGIGQGGDAITLFVGSPSLATIVDYEVMPAAPSGLSYDVVLGAFSVAGSGTVQTGTNIAVATSATAGSDGQEPAIGSPGNKGPLSTVIFDLKISEIFSGQAGTDLTPDWIEIRNTGNTAWEAAVDGDLYYDDESMDPNAATPIQGITGIPAGGVAIVLITDNPEDINLFDSIWSPVIDLSGVAIGYTDGAGLGGGGDLVTLWLKDPFTTAAIDTASYPDTDLDDGKSWDVELQAFSVVGNANGAVATIALGGDLGDVPNIGSPGDGLSIVNNPGLVISEIFSGQAGTDLTPDWIEIRNTGNTAWEAAVDGDLYYDDESMDPNAATPIQGITGIPAGGVAIVLITDNPEDINLFDSIWSPVIDLSGVAIGYTDGAGLGGGGDLVTLWLKDPFTTAAIDTASYPDTDLDDGKSWDVELQAFSVVGNANGAVATIALGGDLGDVPNIGSPGDGLSVDATEIIADERSFTLFPNPTSGQVFLDNPMNRDIGSIAVYSINGAILQSSPIKEGAYYSINLTSLAAGQYVIEITDKKGLKEKKMIIKQ